MLDQLRRHSKSWIVKAALGMIVLTFILFFGYSRIASRYQDSHLYVATVGAEPISRRKFEVIYQRTLDQMRENFKGEMPAGMDNIMKNNVMEQLISRELLVQYADKMHLSVSDQELATAIQANKGLLPDGHFDQTAYEERFLPTYRRQYGEDFETVMERDLMIEKLRALLPALFQPWQSELEASVKEKFPETQPTSRLNDEHLFALWVNQFRDNLKVDVTP